MMPCKCIEDITKAMEGYIAGKYKKPVKNVSLVEILFMFPDLAFVTHSTFEIELEGQKIKETIKINHSYCPFCGKQIDYEKRQAKKL